MAGYRVDNSLTQEVITDNTAFLRLVWEDLGLLTKEEKEEADEDDFMARIAAKIVSAAKNRSVGGKKSIKLEMIGKHMLQNIAKKHFGVKGRDTKKKITWTQPDLSRWLPNTSIQHLVGGRSDGRCDVENICLSFWKDTKKITVSAVYRHYNKHGVKK